MYPRAISVSGLSPLQRMIINLKKGGCLQNQILLSQNVVVEESTLQLFSQKIIQGILCEKKNTY